ncbi:MAG: ATPase [Rhodobacterales bacterium]|nr:MAG: ATPase [Rhodobacterales bacterium]
MAVTRDPDLRRAAALSRAALVAERSARAFWPLWCVLALAGAMVLFGWHQSAPLRLAQAVAAVLAVAAGVALFYGIKRFHWPSRGEALARLDARLPGRPIAALRDAQAVGAGDARSRHVWDAHRARMARAAGDARAEAPDLRLSSRDRWGMRYMAGLALAVAVLFGSVLRVGSVAELVPGPGGTVPAGPVWEGWAEPPRYTGRPTLYMNDIPEGGLSLPQGTAFSFRFYGEAGALNVMETVSGLGSLQADATAQFAGRKSGSVTVDGPGGRRWEILIEPDAAPEVEITGAAEQTRGGGFAIPFAARDDFGVRRGRAEIALDLAAVDRRYGLAADPIPRDPLVLDLPMPFSGDKRALEARLSDDLSEHPWANLPVTVTLVVLDDPGQEGRSAPQTMTLPAKRFFEPLAAAVAEQRRDLLWAPEVNRARVARLLRASGWKPEGIFRKPEHLTQLREIIARIEAEEPLEGEMLDTLASDLWALALELEEGAIENARERLRRARERLAEAMRNGASEAEIAELMDELRAATDAYMDLLAQEAEPAEDDTDQPDSGEDGSRSVEMDEIARLMDEIQRLMEEGRMEEAAILMEQLNQLLDNLRLQEGGDGEGGRKSPGQKSMEELGDTLRDQQDLSDDAFRELQDQFNGRQDQGQPQPGERPQGQQQGVGEQQQGQGQQGQGQQGNGLNGREGAQGQGADEGSLAERQRQLREALEAQRRALPGLPGEEGDAAREALDRAGRAMDLAERALDEGNLPGAIDQQSRALEALREGMDRLGQALARERDQDEAGQGAADGQQADGSTRRPAPLDPLGRQSGNGGGTSGLEGGDLAGEALREQAEALLEELRRRASELERPDAERDYLGRLLERF